MMKRIISMILVGLAVLLVAPMAGRAEGGVVQGQVTNGSAGGSTALGGLEVRIYLFSGNDLKDTPRTETDAQGKFRFEGVPTGSPWAAVVTVEYAKVLYEGKMLDLSAGTEFNADVTVYETTTDDTALNVDRSHLIIEMGSGQLEVTELAILNNAGDRTYIGSEEVVPRKQATAKVPLPSGATDVTFAAQDVADAMIRTGQGFVDTRPIIPGAQEYVLSYALPCDSSTYTLLKPVVYPTQAIDVLVAAPGAEVSAPTLERLGTREATGRSYLHLSGGPLSKDTDVKISFTGLGQAAPGQTSGVKGAEAPATVSRSRWGLNAIAIIGGVLLVGLLGFGLFYQQEVAESAREEQVAAALEARCEDLVAAIADLDDQYEAGALDEDAYTKQRAATKTQLLNLMFSAQGKESDTGVSDDEPRTGSHTGAQPRKAVRPRGRAAQRRSKAR